MNMRSERNGQVIKPGSTTVDKALKVLAAMAETSTPRGSSLAELSNKIGYHKTTVYRLLMTLEQNGFVQQDPDTDRYKLGLKLLELSTVLLDNLELRREASPFLHDLMVKTDETIHLGLLDQFEVVYIDKVESLNPVRMFSRIGTRMPWHCTGLGKAIAAFMPEAKVDELIGHGLPKRTNNTITSCETMREELAKTRARGYSIDNIENEEGIACVAAPIFDYLSRPVSGLSIAGPSMRITPDRFESLGELIKETAMSVSRRMGYRT
jgi:IclR family transcriptional regulator, KDG regulon repressor